MENDAKWLVMAGALPTNKSTGEYVDLQPIFDKMKALGVRVILDTSGEPLQFWAHRGAATVMKPNAEELASAVGKSLVTQGDVIDAARELIKGGVECVLASLGSDGMIAVTAHNAWHAKTPPIKVINTVGAGDSTIAGFLSAIAETTTVSSEENYQVGFDVPAGLKMAVQWGAVKVQQPTSGLQNLDGMPEATVIENPPREALLKEPAPANGFDVRAEVPGLCKATVVEVPPLLFKACDAVIAYEDEIAVEAEPVKLPLIETLYAPVVPPPGVSAS